jgi:imidazolonepropionase-like amidohydrolase
MRYGKASVLSAMALLAFSPALMMGQETLNNVPASIVFYPDTIVYNAKLVTVDNPSVGINTPVGTITQAMAIRDKRVMAVGGNTQILAMAGPKTEKIDVNGRMVMPAIIDTHDHAHGSIANKWQDTHPDPDQTLVKIYNIPSGKTDAEIQAAITAAVKAHVKSTPPGTYALITVARPQCERPGKAVKFHRDLAL